MDAPPRPQNRLLRLLTSEAYDRLRPKLRPAELKAQQVLYEPNHAIDEIFFPETAVICQLNLMDDGRTIETATVGVEGASWISARVGAESMPCQTRVAIGGHAQALGVEDLDREINENQQFADLLTRYSHALLIHSMRLTACTGLHTLRQRCARWILTTLDRVSEDRFFVTHEFLSILLGTTRPTVSLMLEEFRDQGIVNLERGKVLLADRTLLLDASCDCYQVIKENYEQVEK